MSRLLRERRVRRMAKVREYNRQGQVLVERQRVRTFLAEEARHPTFDRNAFWGLRPAAGAAPHVLALLDGA